MVRRVLIVGDRHPALSRGATQLTTYRLYQSMGEQPDVEAFLVASAEGMADRPLGVAICQPFGANEYLIATHGYDPWLGSNPDIDFPAQFETVLRRINPDVVHFRSSALIGLEAIAQVKRVLPGAIAVVDPDCLILPLARTDAAGDLFLAADLERRFPGRSKNDDLLRWLYQRRFLLAADRFIADSSYGAGRMAEAGLPADRMIVWRLGCLSPGLSPVSSARSDLVVGIFGLDGASDGLDVLLRFARVLDADSGLRIEICPVAGDEAIPAVDDLPFAVSVPCAPEGIGARMQDCDLVLIPGGNGRAAAILVEEARAARRPVLCPDVGAAASIVRHGLDGFHFAAASGASLAGLIKDLRAQPAIGRKMQQSIEQPTMPQDAVRALRAFYDGVTEPS